MELFKHFQKWNPGIIKMMKECSHHFSSSKFNPYHLEGDVFTHTCLAYNQLINLKEFNQDYPIIKYAAISILCHDIGKIYTRHSPKFGKIAMYGHAFASIQDTIEFLFYLKDKGFFQNEKEYRNSFYYVLTAISNHMDYMFAKKEDRLKLANNDKYLKLLSDILCYCDINGSFAEKNDREIEIEKVNKLFTYGEENNIIVDIAFICGVPGCGKDYIAKCTNNESGEKVKILSFDDIRINLYKENKSITSQSNNEIYENAFKFCNKNRIDLKKELIYEMEKAINEGYEKIFICNTSLNRKSRKSLINSIKNNNKFKNKKVGAIFVCADKEIILERNKKRKNKNLDEFVIYKFMYNQQIPLLKEGFDAIMFTQN